MRLIDADDFGNRMYHEVFEKDSEDQKWDSGCWMRYKLFERVLREQPTIEPMRKKGWWQEITASDCSGYDPTLAGYDDPVVGCICSVCREGYEKELMGEVYWNFCPNCGADMRGKKEENNS